MEFLFPMLQPVTTTLSFKMNTIAKKIFVDYVHSLINQVYNRNESFILDGHENDMIKHASFIEDVLNKNTIQIMKEANDFFFNSFENKTIARKLFDNWSKDYFSFQAKINFQKETIRAKSLKLSQVIQNQLGFSSFEEIISEFNLNVKEEYILDYRNGKISNLDFLLYILGLIES